MSAEHPEKYLDLHAGLQACMRSGYDFAMLFNRLTDTQTDSF